MTRPRPLLPLFALAFGLAPLGCGGTPTAAAPPPPAGPPRALFPGTRTVWSAIDQLIRPGKAGPNCSVRWIPGRRQSCWPPIVFQATFSGAGD